MDEPISCAESMLPEGRVGVPEHVVRRTFQGETVVLNLKTGQYHGLNPIAGRMFDMLEEMGDAQATAQRVATEFEVPLEIVAADLAELCRELAARGLIVVDDG